jgi:hypothetical protein
MRYISARRCLKGLDLMAGGGLSLKKIKLHSEKYFKGRSPTAPKGRKAEIVTSVDQMRIDDPEATLARSSSFHYEFMIRYRDMEESALLSYCC